MSILNEIRVWNDFLWYWFSNIILLAPMTFLVFYKLMKPIDWNLLKKHDKKIVEDFGDKFLTVVSSYSLLYYAVDCIIKIMTGTYKASCDFSMFLHHVTSLIFLPTVCFAPHWPWFWIAPGAMHAFLIAFPNKKWLNYVYIFIIFLFQYGLYQEPFTNLKEYKRMKLGIVCIEISCFFIWWFDCSNELVGITFDEN